MVCWAVGVGLYFSGYFDDAERWFNQCSALGEHWHFAASSLAYRSIIAGERGRRDEQAALAEQALALTRERGVEETHAEAQLAMAMSFLDRGEPAAARPLADRGVDIARSFGQPVSLAYALIRQAKVLRTLDERDAAAAALEEATTIVASCRDPGTLRACLESFKARPPRRPKKPSTTLSDRERIVLRMLTGPLSERDIGRELYLSHNTIHSHTRSIYRKLGVRSRREAIGLARQLGLL
jgi:LuxR family maltose regulon positive regulatory protein